MDYLLIVAALFLALSNGANDNFKGFATVWGSKTLTYRTAIVLATTATVAGSLCSLFLAEALAQQFSGKGLVPDATANAPLFLLSVSIGAALTVFAATRTGLPISTTHALIGGLVGAGIGLGSGELHLEKLATTFLLPLIISPLLAALLGWLAYRFMRKRPAQKDCACVVIPTVVPGVVQQSNVAMLTGEAPTILLASDSECDTLPTAVSRFSISRFNDKLHTFSAVLICFARGVNDTPKLAALLTAAHVLNSSQAVIAIAVCMGAGGLLFAHRVAHTMSHKLSRIDSTQGLAANLITALMVLFASKLGLPVSTTHVSVGSIAGVGAGANSLSSTTVRNVFLSWVATLPMAAAFAWLVQWIGRLMTVI